MVGAQTGLFALKPRTREEVRADMAEWLAYRKRERVANGGASEHERELAAALPVPMAALLEIAVPGWIERLRALDDAIATGAAPPPRARRRRILSATPLVALVADDFDWARRLVSSISRKHEYLRDDIEAEAMLALHLASLDYRPGGNQFRSYAAMKIRGAAMDFLRTQNRSVRNAEQCKEPERQKPARIIGLDDHGWSRLPAHEDSPDELLDQKRQRLRLDRMMSTLRERDASMVRMHVFDEIAMKDVGAHFGVTESRVCQIVNAALENIAGKKVSLKRLAA